MAAAGSYIAWPVIDLQLQAAATLGSGERSAPLVAQIGTGELITLSVDDSTLHVWDSSSGDLLGALRRLSEHIRCICGTRAGLLTGDNAGAVRLHGLSLGDAGRVIREYRGHSHIVRALVALGDDEFASGSCDATVRVWQLSTGATLATLVEHEAAVISLTPLRLAPVCATLASGDNAGTIKVWDVARRVCIISMRGGGGVLSMAETGEGLLVSCMADGALVMWDLRMRACVHVWRQSTAQFVCAMGSALLATSSHDGTISLWHTPSRRHVHRIDHLAASGSCMVLNDGRLLVGSHLSDHRHDVLGVTISFAWARRRLAMTAWLISRLDW